MIIIQIQNFYKKAVDFLDKNKEFSIYASDVMVIDAYGKQFRRANLKEDFPTLCSKCTGLFAEIS